jgi:hypothetical protein
MSNPFISDLIIEKGECSECLYDQGKIELREMNKEICSPSYCIKHQLDIRPLCLRIYCLHNRLWSVSVRKDEDGNQRNEKKKKSTVLFCKASAKYSDPSSSN